MSQILAHSLDSNRTKDVILDENVSFESLLLNENVLKGLTKCGFKKPSPIQVKAIPVGRCGFDLIVKAKSGTGKTLVYSIIGLETIEVHKNQIEVLILAPTREIAVQIQEVLLSIGNNIQGLKVASFIGGLPIEGDKEKCKVCHIAVGAPGRVKHLIKEGILKTNSVRLLVLDEADKLMESSFLNDVNEIFNSLPDRKQIITTSATYSNELKTVLYKYMLSPTYIAVEENSTPLLLGLKQFVRVIEPHANVVQQMKIKNQELLNIFSNISFTQCLVFTNYQTRAQSISNILNQNGWHSTYISAAQSQTERLATVKDLKNFKCRIMLSTDLTARGIDAANVDMVINYDIPIDTMTYLHRMGRAGRYGSSGICINLAFDGNELQQLQNILGVIGGQSLSIPKLHKFKGTLSDLLNMSIPAEDHIYGTISSNFKTASTETKINIKRNILELKETKMKGKGKNKPQNSKEISDVDRPEIKRDNSEERIMDILNVAKKEVEAVSENLSGLDPSVILKSLASGDSKMNLDIACATSSCPTIKQFIVPDAEECKKRKRCTEDKGRELYDFEDDQLKEKQKAEERLYHKNRALISLSNILSSEKCDKEFGASSIERYLSNLKEEDRTEVGNVMIKNESLNEVDLLKNIDKLDGSHQTYTKATSNECIDNIENIFKLGYESQINSCARHWQSYLSESEIKRFKNLRLKETDHNEDCDEIDEETYDDCDMEKDYYCDYSELYDNNERDEEYANDDCMKWIPVVNTTEQTRQVADPEVTDREHFNKYFNQCSEYLWHNGLSFSSVEDFDNWYQNEWQEQVLAVRNYTEQYIYVEEMKKYQEMSSKL